MLNQNDRKFKICKILQTHDIIWSQNWFCIRLMFTLNTSTSKMHVYQHIIWLSLINMLCVPFYPFAYLSGNYSLCFTQIILINNLHLMLIFCLWWWKWSTMTSVIPDPSMSLLMYSSGLSSNNSSSASVSSNTVLKEYTTQESLQLLYHYASVNLHVWHKKAFAR